MAIPRMSGRWNWLALLLVAAAVFAGCANNEGWYYEVTTPPADGCVSAHGRQWCGFVAARQYQVDGWSYTRDEDRNLRPPDPRLWAEVPGLAGSAAVGTPMAVIPVSALLRYGRFLRGEPRPHARWVYLWASIIELVGFVLFACASQTRDAVIITTRPLAILLWGAVIQLIATATVGAAFLNPNFAFLSLSVLAAGLAVVLLPRTARKCLGVGATEAVLQAYFALRGSNALEERRRQYMREQERQRMDEETRRIEREEADLKAKIRGETSGDAEEFFEMLESVPPDVERFHGYVEEVKRRWIERQLKKSVDVTRERLQATASLYGAYAEIQRRKREMVREHEAFKRVREDVANDALAQHVEREKLRTQLEAYATERTRLEAEHKALTGREPGVVGEGGRTPLVLGAALDQGDTPRRVSLPAELQRRHVYIIGQTQSGKTTLIQNLVRQEIERGSGCAFIDPHGDAAPQLLRYIPERRIEDVVYLDFTARNPVVAFNPLDAPTDQRQGLVEDFISYFGRFFETDVTTAPRMTHILRYALLTLLGSGMRRTVADLERLLVDPEFRKEILRAATEPAIQDFWAKQFPDPKRAEVQPILTRLSGLLAPGSQLRTILSQPENRVDFDEILNGGKVLLVRLSKGRGLETATHFLGALIVTRIQQEAMARAELGQSERRAFSLYVDEFQNYTVTSFETILSESAKYRLSVAMANQTFHSLSASLRTAIRGNVGTVVAFRIGSEDAHTLHPEIRKRIERPGRTPTGTPTVEEVWYPSADDLVNQRPYRAFVRLGRPEDVEAIRTSGLPPVPQRGEEIGREVVRWSRRRYYHEADQESLPPRSTTDFLE